MALEEPRTIRKITRVNAKHRKRSEETLWNGGSSAPLSATTSDKKRRTKMLKAWQRRLFNSTIKENTAKTEQLSICFNDPKPASCVKTSEVAQMCSSLPRRRFLPWYQRRSFVNIVPLKFSQDSPSSGSSGSNDWTSVGNKRKGYQRNFAGLSVNRNDRRTKEILISKHLESVDHGRSTLYWLYYCNGSLYALSV